MEEVVDEVATRGIVCLFSSCKKALLLNRALGVDGKSACIRSMGLMERDKMVDLDAVSATASSSKSS